MSRVVSGEIRDYPDRFKSEIAKAVNAARAEFNSEMTPDLVRYEMTPSEIAEAFADAEGPQKPAVTREQYEQGRAVLDALPAGFYVKTACCGRWYTGGNYGQDSQGKPICRAGAGCDK